MTSRQTRYWTKLWACRALIAMCVAAAPTASRGATFTVNATVDAPDALPGNGVCEGSAAGQCSFRAAIMEANALAGPDAVIVPGGTYVLTRNAELGAPQITDELVITGAADSPGTVIDGNAAASVLVVWGAPADIARLTFQNGQAQFGGGIGVGAGASLLLRHSTVTGNVASQGAGIWNLVGSVELVNSTISGNTATGAGGGLSNYGVATLLNTTISDNTAPAGGGLVSLNNLRLRNTILARNTPDNCAAGGVVSDGHNLATDASCPLSAAADQPNVPDAGLAKLDYNGGPTRTLRLKPGSPAIDAGDAAACPATDQRGRGRNDGDNDLLVVCDIGSFELTDWKRRIAGEAGGVHADAHAVTAAGGRVFAAGSVATTSTEEDFAVVALDQDSGAEMWRQEIDGTDTGLDFDQAQAIAADAAGDVIAAGSLTNAGTGPDFTVGKFRADDGSLLWLRQIDGAALNSSDAAWAVAIDGGGDVVAAGQLDPTNGNPKDFAVVKLRGSDGQIICTRQYAGMGFDKAVAVAIDAADDITAAGTMLTPTGQDFTVVKLSGFDCSQVWIRHLDGTADGYESATAVAVQPTGDVVAAGWTASAPATGRVSEFTVARFRGTDGAVLWRTDLEGPTFGGGVAEAVVALPDGDVVAAGMIQDATAEYFAVVKLSGATGSIDAPRWIKLIKGTSSSSNRAFALTLDSVGRIIAAGQLRNTATGLDFTLLKLRAFDGYEVFREALDGGSGLDDEAVAVTVDGYDGIAGAGTMRRPQQLEDFTVVKREPPSSGCAVGPSDNSGALLLLPCAFILWRRMRTAEPSAHTKGRGGQ